MRLLSTCMPFIVFFVIAFSSTHGLNEKDDIKLIDTFDIQEMFLYKIVITTFARFDSSPAKHMDQFCERSVKDRIELCKLTIFFFKFIALLILALILALLLVILFTSFIIYLCICNNRKRQIIKDLQH